MRVKSLALGAILGVSAGAAANAQMAPQPPTVGQERQFNFEGRLTAYYDSNISRTSKGAAAARGIEPEDWVLSPAVAANVVQPLGRQRLFLDGSAGYDFHRENPRLDRGRYDVTAGGVASLGICRPLAYGTYQAFQSDLADVDLVTTKNFQETVLVAAGGDCGRPIGLSGSVLAQRSDTKNSAASMVVQDHTTETLLATARYGNPNLANVSLIWVYSNHEFPNRIIPGRPVGDGFWTQTVGLQVERRLGARINFGGSASRTYLKREFAPPGDRLDFTTTTYDAALSYRAGTRMTLELEGGRQVKPSNRPGKLYDISESVEGRVRYRLNPRVNLSAGHIYTDLSSNVDTVGARAVLTNALTNSSYANVEYRGFKRASLRLEVRYEDRDTNLPVFNYSATRVGLTTTVGF
jgi:hypothetical protein